MTGFATHPWLSGYFKDPKLSDLFSIEAEVPRLLRVEAAWTRALSDIDGNRNAEQIAQAIETANVPIGHLNDGMEKDGVPIPALVQFLKDALPNDASPYIHHGLTSQDVLDTSFVLLLIDVLEETDRRLNGLGEELENLERRFGDRRLPAFTRLQPALETTVGALADRWRHPVKNLEVKLQSLRQEIGAIQWGGPIGERNHPDAGALGAAFAKHLGLRDLGRSWHTDRTVILDFVRVMEQVSVVTGKIGEDIALYAVTGTGQFITLQGGRSSAMPHKNNPVDAEALIALADFTALLTAGAGRSARHEGYRSGQAWMLEWLTLPQLCMAVCAGLLISTRLIASIQEFGEK